MMIKLIFFVLLVFGFSCGRDVSIGKNKLENLPNIDSLKYKNEGTLTKGSPSILSYDGKEYNVSKYSSKNALDFISTLTDGQKTEVKFSGIFEGKEVSLQIIERK